ncbi:MAG TPA: MFS transporter [Rectinemataceae bacterium]|nr:MFS transporter [Rectinemataceae bacterium]
MQSPKRALLSLVLPAWSTRDIGLVFSARFFMSATRALAGIVLPVYLASLGYSGFALGILYSLSAIASAILSTLIGWGSDRFGRKPFLIATPLLTALACLAFMYFREALPLFAFAALGSLGRGAGAGAGMIGPYQPAEQAYLTAKVGAKDRNALFGRMAFTSSLGALVGGGPAIALATLLASGKTPDEFRLEFLFGALFALVCALLAIPLGEKRPPAPAAKKPRAESGRRGLGARLSPTSWKILLRLWVTNGVNGLAVGFFGPLITYWFNRRFGASPLEIGVLYSLINLASLSSNLASSRVASRFGIVRTIVVSRFAQAILIVPMVLAPSFWLAGAIYLVRMMVQRLGLPLRQSFVMGVVPDEERGRVGSLSNLPSQASSALSPSLAGYIFERLSMDAPFAIGALLQGVNAFLFMVFFRDIRPPEEAPTTESDEKVTQHCGLGSKGADSPI